jgi:hypothetical protein
MLPIEDLHQVLNIQKKCAMCRRLPFEKRIETVPGNQERPAGLPNREPLRRVEEGQWGHGADHFRGPLPGIAPNTHQGHAGDPSVRREECNYAQPETRKLRAH